MSYKFIVLLQIIMITHVQSTKTDIDILERTGSNEDISRKYVRKCCPFGKGLIDSDCHNTSEPFSVNDWRGNGGFNASEDVDIEIGIKCSRKKGFKLLEAYPAYYEDEYYLLANGTLKILMKDTPTTVFDRDKYCIENYLTKQGTYVINALFCQKNPEQLKDIKYILKACCMLTSCFFILLTVIVYAILPKMFNLHNTVLITYLLSFSVSFLCLATVTFLKDKGPTRTLCEALTFIIYFFTLAALCWINVMSYNTWNKFGGKLKNRINTSDAPWSCYYWYSLYGFGVPTVLTAWFAICEYTDIPVPIKPELGVQKCFFDGTVKQVYLYVPILILCTGNIILFMLTALKIAYDQRMTDHSLSQDSRIHNRRDRERLFIYIKLFTLMGISWIFEVVDSFHSRDSVLSHIINAYNLLVGFVIFIMFVSRKETYNKIKARLICLSMSKEPTSQTILTVSQRTQSSQSASSMAMDAAKKNGHNMNLNNARNVKNADNYIKE